MYTNGIFSRPWKSAGHAGRFPPPPPPPAAGGWPPGCSSCPPGCSKRRHPFHPPASAARSQGPIQPAAHAFGSPVQAGSSGLPLPYLNYNYHKSRLSVKPETRAGSRPPLCRQGAGAGPSGQIYQKIPSYCLPGPGRAPRKTQRRAGRKRPTANFTPAPNHVIIILLNDC